LKFAKSLKKNGEIARFDLTGPLPFRNVLSVAQSCDSSV
jgi:hypothetical protein